MARHFSFRPLTRQDLPLLLQWLETPHVKAWWDHDIIWTPALIEEKYESYCVGYKQIGNTKKPLQAFIVLYNGAPVGYIQCYNVYDHPHEDGVDVSNLSQQCAAIDFYIGDPAHIGKGLGVKLLTEFLNQHVWRQYDSCFVDPDKGNTAAIKTYERAGFVAYGETATAVLMCIKIPENLNGKGT